MNWKTSTHLTPKITECNKIRVEQLRRIIFAAAKASRNNETNHPKIRLDDLDNQFVAKWFSRGDSERDAMKTMMRREAGVVLF